MQHHVKVISPPPGYTEVHAPEAVGQIEVEDPGAWPSRADVAVIAEGRWFAPSDEPFDEALPGAPQFAWFERRDELAPASWDFAAQGHEPALPPATDPIDTLDLAGPALMHDRKIIRWKPDWAASWHAIVATMHRALLRWEGLLLR